MKKLLFPLVFLLTTSAHADLSLTKVKDAFEVLSSIQCYVAMNPEDAQITLFEDDSKKPVAVEKATLLQLDVKTMNGSLQSLRAESKTLSFQNLGTVQQSKDSFTAGIDCDGGGWKITYVGEGAKSHPVLSEISAVGAVKDSSLPVGCQGTGSIQSTKPIEFVSVSCQ